MIHLFLLCIVTMYACIALHQILCTCQHLIFYAVTVDIDGVSQIDYSLIQAPVFTSSYVQSDIKVEYDSHQLV